MNRRTVLKALACLPVIGSAFKPAEAVPVKRSKPWMGGECEGLPRIGEPLILYPCDHCGGIVMQQSWPKGDRRMCCMFNVGDQRWEIIPHSVEVPG